MGLTEYYIVQISISWNDNKKELCACHPHNTMGCVYGGEKHSIQSLHVYNYVLCLAIGSNYNVSDISSNY